MSSFDDSHEFGDVDAGAAPIGIGYRLWWLQTVACVKKNVLIKKRSRRATLQGEWETRFRELVMMMMMMMPMPMPMLMSMSKS